MHPIFLALALLALFGVHLARLPARGGILAASGAFLIGLVAAALLIRLVLGGLGIGRTTDFDRVVNDAVARVQADEAPLIVFSGASYSRNAIDDHRLTEILRARGYPHRAVNLSLEAASMLERRAHLDAFIARSGRVPDIVFIEVAGDFDLRVAQFFDNSKFSVRGIEQFGPAATIWTARGLAGGACPGLTGCLKDTALLGAHAALNFMNVGLAASAQPPGQAGRLASYDPQTEPREEVDLMDRAIGLGTSDTSAPAASPDWARALRDTWRARLEAKGVRAIGYYFPPVIDPGKRAYAEALCRGELAGLACISPQDPALLDALDADVWFDPAHLLDPGAQTYVTWLAVQLETSGMLGDHGAPAIKGAGKP